MNIRDRNDPKIYDTFLYAPHISVYPEDQLRQNKDLQRKTRRFLYPPVRVICKILIPIILAVKRILPRVGYFTNLAFGSLKKCDLLMHRTIFCNTFMSRPTSSTLSLRIVARTAYTL